MSANTVLVVDDSTYVHKMVKAYLEGEAVTVHSAFDGPAGVAEAEKLKPDLILLDIDMPGLGGIDACRQLKANPTTEHTSIIFLTADCSIHDKVKAFELGAIDYITKPCKPEELRARVRTALRVTDRFQHASMVDPATSLWNEAYLRIQVNTHGSLARRLGQPLSCIVAQVDSLDVVEKKHGAELAMSTVRNIANVFVGQSRSEDVICRLTDGRFVSLDPATGGAGAVRHADRLRMEIERQLMHFQDLPLGVTCSFGVALAHQDGSASLLEDAEKELIWATECGGNMVRLAPASTNSKG